jgi:hypothetical protein
LPEGLTLGSSGIIGGVLTVSGTFTFTVEVTDSSSPAQTGIATLTLNIPPTTSVLVPSAGTTVQGNTYVDAGASSQNAMARVKFEISGGSISDQVIGSGTATQFGWLAQWNTTGVPNGTYAFQSVATDNHGLSGTSAPITVTVDNPHRPPA